MLPCAALLCAALLCAALLCACASGGDEEPLTGASACDPPCSSGCCYQGQCVLGNLQAACGTDGASCVACPPGATCEQGRCTSSAPEPSCGPGQCAGCCAGGTCITLDLQSAALCGQGGQSCVSCAKGQCAAGVCSAPPPCDASNCAGCCSASGQCLPIGDQSASQCGSAGTLCASCPGGACHGGVCGGDASPCAASCAGCCQGETCVLLADQSSSTCGASGAACRPCVDATPTCSQGQCQASAPAKACDALGCAEGCCKDGQCVLPAAQSTAACGTAGDSCQQCGAGQSCSAGACITAWRVFAVSAEVEAKSPKDWDEGQPVLSGPQPDPMVECTVLSTGRVGASKSVTDSYSPSWNTELLIDDQAALDAGLSCEIFDDDSIWGAQKMGACPVNPTVNHFSIDNFTLKVGKAMGCSGHVKLLEIRFVKKH